ncbi:MAG: prenyltransferase/squalene oxidase repeat-containing protein [Actinomycetota bacterium]|nr:prenyltransferase/squalene oxidase repeat-containing protein [Actinomycetota bacterium]
MLGKPQKRAAKVRKICLLLLAVFITWLFLSSMALFSLLASAEQQGGGSEVNLALSYLRGKQRLDGGFSEGNATASSDQLTAWAILAIRAAGEEPDGVRKGGKSPVEFLASTAPGWKALTEVMRGCLAVSATKANPHSFGGRNLVAEIKSNMGADGHIGSLVNEHMWGMLALAAAGEQLPPLSRTWLSSQQNPDGGFGYSSGGASDPDNTAAAIQALMSAGESKESSTIKRALSFLRFCQANDGGFCWQSAHSNCASTSWAIQAIIAAGEDPASAKWSKGNKNPMSFLKSLQCEDGHIKYSSTTDSNPVWMTAEAIPALSRCPFPLNAKKAGNKTDFSSPAGVSKNSQATTQSGSPKTESNPLVVGNQAESESPKALSSRNENSEKTDKSENYSSEPQEKNQKDELILFLLFCEMYLAALPIAPISAKLIREIRARPG